MMTFDERCKLATECLPLAEYRTRLEALHSELLEQRRLLIDEASENKQRARGFEKSAERYRKIRRGQHWSVVDGIGTDLRGDALDAAVDAAPGPCWGTTK